MLMSDPQGSENSERGKHKYDWKVFNFINPSIEKVIKAQKEFPMNLYLFISTKISHHQ
jgi:hypothetical protein